MPTPNPRVEDLGQRKTWRGKERPLEVAASTSESSNKTIVRLNHDLP